MLKKYREEILNALKKYIEKILIENNFEAQLINYGSYVTKLSIEISDIDILIKFYKNGDDNLNTNNNKHIEEIISLLYNKLNNNKEIFNILVINAIYTASVPVLKLKCSLENIIPNDIKKQIKNNYLFNFEEDIMQLNFDFTFLEVNNIKESIFIPSLEIISYIQNVINNYKEIKPILLFLKRYMKINNINSSFHGGLSSYSLFLLVYGYIKSFNISGLSVGNYLYGFLDFYSNFNFGIHSINVSFNNPFVVLNELHEAGIMLIDPITKLNVAKSTFRVDQIKSVLMKGVIIIRNIIYQKMIGNKNFNYENSKNIFLDELFKNKNYKIIDSIGNHISNQNSFEK
jgi:DNA polymerase sigma